MGEHLRLTKSELRRRAREVRGARPPGEIAHASRAICARVSQLSAFRLARHVIAYAARPDEVDPSALVESALADGKHLYFPAVSGPGLTFRAATPDQLARGRRGVLEPTSGRPLPPAASRVVFLIPGLGFDPAGRRLGRGGGHYDRALAEHPRGVRLGLAIDAELSPALPVDEWDEPVDAVATERRLLWSSARVPMILEENLA
jgi:5-formyltetrahydrofolate cyclo-ligase